MNGGADQKQTMHFFQSGPFFYRSEIHAVMTGGFATIAGTVLGAYINFGTCAE